MAEIDKLRRERDRFVGFAFSAADLLLEVDDQLIVRYAAGAHGLFTGSREQVPVGEPLLPLVAERDRALVEFVLKGLGVGGRLNPVTLHTQSDNKPITLGACRLPHHDNLIFLSLSKEKSGFLSGAPDAERDGETGLLKKDDFSNVVADLVGNAKEGESDDRLTLIQLSGLEEFRSRTEDTVVREFLGRTGAYLRTKSQGGDAVGRLADDKYGVVHGSNIEAAELADAVGEISRRADPSGLGIVIEQHCVDLKNQGYSETDLTHIVRFTIEKFVETHGKGFAITSLSDGFTQLVKVTTTRYSKLRHTVSSDAFEILFQPIVVLDNRQLHHFEVLSRFPHEESVAEAVSFAEGIGIINDLDLAVCRRAIEVILDSRVRNEAVGLAVNISGRSLESSLFVSALRDMMASLGDLRKNLLLEITETSQLEDLNTARSVLQQLRKDGHAICLDDFGSGASSFPYLQALSIDYVKIDGSYVREVPTSSQDMAIVRSMVTLCKELGIRTIAEMIETEEQARQLQALEINLGQGWLFGRPQAQIPTTVLPLLPAASSP